MKNQPEFVYISMLTKNVYLVWCTSVQVFCSLAPKFGTFLWATRYVGTFLHEETWNSDKCTISTWLWTCLQLTLVSGHHLLPVPGRRAADTDNSKLFSIKASAEAGTVVLLTTGSTVTCLWHYCLHLSSRHFTDGQLDPLYRLQTCRQSYFHSAAHSRTALLIFITCTQEWC